ncbi:Uncharacterised protein [Mycobacteroides abscessus subsp. abscessus]|nr:Uncharacterised protein [Mycobacteroides abscessus subsp. abscessus]
MPKTRKSPTGRSKPFVCRPQVLSPRLACKRWAWSAGKPHSRQMVTRP